MNRINRNLYGPIVFAGWLALTGCAPTPTPTGSTTRSSTEAERIPALSADNTGVEDSDGESETESSNIPKEAFLKAVDLAGHQEAIDAGKGKVTLVEYWATWCGECCEMLPHTIELGTTRKVDGLRVLTVSMDTADDHQAALEFLTEHDATGTTNLRTDHEKFEAENSDVFSLTEQKLPYFKLFDREGQLIATFSEEEATHENIEKAVEEALNAK